MGRNQILLLLSSGEVVGGWVEEEKPVPKVRIVKEGSHEKNEGC